MSKLTPMMQQYMEIKEKYKDSILFFRLGDFYEMFFEDAKLASRELEITLTERGAGMEEKVPMAGVPHHVADSYISRLVERGYKVAICEQVEDPSEAKGIVRRDVVKVVTPGTITDESVLDEKSNNYLASIYYDDFGVGLSYVDNSTGELHLTELIGNKEELLSFILNEVNKIYPSELLINSNLDYEKEVQKIIKTNIDPYINIVETFSITKSKEVIEKHFSDFVLSKTDILNKTHSMLSLSNLISYLKETEKSSLEHIKEINYYEANNYMILDYNTRINLEIDQTIIGNKKKGSILGFLDETATAMGGRLLKKWLEQPLVSKNEIEYRNNIVENFVNDLILKDELRDDLKKIYDIERLGSKIATGACNGRDLISLKNSISVLPEIKKTLNDSGLQGLKNISDNIDPLLDIYNLLEKSIEENPPITITEGNLIKEGFNKDLDEIKSTSKDGLNWLKELESREKKSSGINNLKIGYNKILGYYFEVTKANIKKVPEHFIRRQTLTNSERYFTDELKEMEDKIVGAEEKLLEYEYKIFLEVRDKIKEEVDRIKEVSHNIAKLDVLSSFAEVAYNNDFIKPTINNEGIINIVEGRHPVVEANIENELFVPNDTYLDLEDNMIQIITGPNMAGKSTYMRQIAVITLLAHIGSFVPATEANISITDRIFTRIGAADNLSQGQSTFMVEMNEVANIVNSATRQSLIILDEVGRGTSTYDGLSIAWALVEYIAEDIKAKTLFATHYHELVQLEKEYSSIKNLTILAEEKGEDIIFLRKVVPGSTNRSYGIEVAKLAGIDQKIISRANEVLYLIENNNKIDLDDKEYIKESEQLDLNTFKKDSLIEHIKKIDPDNMTPREAFNKLYDLVEEANRLEEI